MIVLFDDVQQNNSILPVYQERKRLNLTIVIQIRSAFFYLQVIDDCGHTIHLERPQEFNDIVRKTLARVDPVS